MISEEVRDQLRTLTDPRKGGRYLLAAVAVDGPGDRQSFLTGRLGPDDRPRDRPELAEHAIRVASISKAVTARAVLAVSNDGALDLSDPIADQLRPHGYPEWLREHGARVRDLLCHCSGLVDRAGYFTDPPDDLPAFLGRGENKIRAAWAPGDYFFYANINYVLLGAILEAVTGTRFDRIVEARVLAPLGLSGWFNWARAGDGDRQARIALYERHGSGYALEVDGPEGAWHANLVWRGGMGIDLAAYRPVRDTHLFSPHAGFRTSIGMLARLARSFGDDTREARAMRDTAWRYDGINGAWSDGLFPEVGLGLSRFESHPVIPGPRVGHAGHALGFTGGAWCDLDTGRGWAYWLSGSKDATAGREEEGFFSPEEVRIFKAI